MEVNADLSGFADQLAALGILRRLLQALPDALTVTEIQDATDTTGSTLSHHLDRLQGAPRPCRH